LGFGDAECEICLLYARCCKNLVMPLPGRRFWKIEDAEVFIFRLSR
jgi:hypothetical protein